MSSVPLPTEIPREALETAAADGTAAVIFSEEGTGDSKALGELGDEGDPGASSATDATADLLPMTGTPTGFKLFDPGTRVDDWRYRSTTLQTGTGPCSRTSCTATEKTNYVFKETITGGSSKADSQTRPN